MAGCGYHSPQFSEDIAWLPAWLQPHQIPHIGDHSKDEQPISLVACKNQASFQGNTYGGQAGQLFTSDDAKYNSFHLYLSGEDITPAEITPSPGQELHFRLQLSSVGISQHSSGQLNETPQTGRSCRKPFETSAVQKGTSCQYKLDDDVPASESIIGCNPILISEPLTDDQNNWQRFQRKFNASNPRSADIDVEVLQTEKQECEGSLREPIPETPLVGYKPRMLHMPVSATHVNADQNDRQGCQGRLDSGNLQTVDINDAVELSIAASEAIVISEMASSSSLSELLLAPAILEIALRVKQARNSEVVSVFSNDELDETDQLCDLDECSMDKAFDDVGLSVTQIVGTLENSFCHGKSPQQQMLQSSPGHCEHKEEAKRKQLKAQDVDTNKTIYQIFNAFADESRSKNLPLGARPVLQTRSTTLLPMDSITSCLRYQSIAHTEMLIQNADAQTTIQMDSKDDRGIIKESKAIPQRDTSIKKPIKELFNRETSSISESMDVVDECTLEQRPGADREIVASSSTASKDLSRCPYKENESTREGIISSQDFVRYSSSSLVDPLCSIVPCSISSEDAPMKETEENGEKFMNSATAVGLPNPQEALPVKLLYQGAECLLSKISVEVSGLPTRKQSNSLKPYSMLMPCQNTAGELVFQNESIPENLMNESRCRDQTYPTSCVPQQSSLCSHPANKRRPLDKKVRFLEAKSVTDRTKADGSLQSGYQTRSQRRTRKKMKDSFLTSCRVVHGKGMIFQGLEFLLTGFSIRKEKELEAFIRKYGGYVLSNIPSFPPDLRGKRKADSERLKLPIVLSPRKVQTTKFLYGCATNTWMLNANWLIDSVQASSVLPPGKYMTRPIQNSGRNYLRIGEPVCFDNQPFIFDRLGIMLYGKASFCTKYFKIIKHGGGQVFKTLQRLVQSLKSGRNTVGAIIVENEGSVSRHLKYCAFEHNLQTMPASWIVDSLFSGKLLPFKKDRCAPLHRIKMPTFPRAQDLDMSEEI